MLSIYIHWPFCLSLCPYCDFNSHVASSINYQQWSDAYLKELEYFLPVIQNKKITSIFFGGGTPSLMSPSIIYEIINFLSKNAKLDKPEITLEANPTSSESDKFKEFKHAGINRLSLGIQSLNDKALKILGRKHNSAEAIAAINMARNVFTNYSFDLIYSIPDQTLESWKRELDSALKLAGNHLSLYQLTIEKGTPFYKLHKDGKLILPENDLSADMYELTGNIMEESGYLRYEISNYAKPGFECIHNLAYWNYQNYLGIGPGAHSRVDGNAIMMVHNPQKWLQSVSTNSHGIQKQIKLSSLEKTTEMVMMGLRINDGIKESEIYNKTRKNFEEIFNLSYLDTLIKNNFIEKNADSIKLTSKGLSLHSYIVPRLMLNK